ncbi:MAG: restriction endonuclease subunit S [Eubacterium sp.]|nr:restriction endonuclease subunit S [Eubacterium sp.]
MSEIKKRRLGDFCKTNIYSYSKKDDWQYVNYLDTGNITKNKIDSIQYIDMQKDKLPSRAKRKVEIDNIIYSTVRPNQEHFGIIKRKPSNFLVSTGFTVLEVDKRVADADYVYYFLSEKYIVAHLHAIAEQSVSAYPSIKPSDIEDLIIKLPEITVQKRVSSILNIIDEKIELNDKINYRNFW